MAEPFHSFAKEIIEAKPICFLEENVLFIVSPKSHVVKGAGNMQARSSCHKLQSTTTLALQKSASGDRSCQKIPQMSGLTPISQLSQSKSMLVTMSQTLSGQLGNI